MLDSWGVSSTGSEEATNMSQNSQFFQCALKTFEIESAAIQRTIDGLSSADFDKACELLLNATGRVIVTGMGKSGHIARKLASTLSSTGTPAIFLHPAEAAHGDIGLLKEGDVMLMLSKSGGSEELFSVLPAVMSRRIPIIAITASTSSRLATAATQSGGVVLKIVVDEEACPNDLAPTASTTATLVLGDAIAMALLDARKFTSQDFAKLHPAGVLGRSLTMTVRDLMASGEAIPVVSPSTDLSEVMHEISRKRFGCAIVMELNRLIGIITDGDLRRYFQQIEEVHVRKICARDIAISSPRTIQSSSLASEALRSMEQGSPKVMQLVVVERDLVVGMIHLHDIVKAGIS